MSLPRQYTKRARVNKVLKNESWIILTSLSNIVNDLIETITISNFHNYRIILNFDSQFLAFCLFCSDQKTRHPRANVEESKHRFASASFIFKKLNFPLRICFFFFLWGAQTSLYEYSVLDRELVKGSSNWFDQCMKPTHLRGSVANSFQKVCGKRILKGIGLGPASVWVHIGCIHTDILVWIRSALLTWIFQWSLFCSALVLENMNWIPSGWN